MFNGSSDALALPAVIFQNVKSFITFQWIITWCDRQEGVCVSNRGGGRGEAQHMILNNRDIGGFEVIRNANTAYQYTSHNVHETQGKSTPIQVLNLCSVNFCLFFDAFDLCMLPTGSPVQNKVFYSAIPDTFVIEDSYRPIGLSNKRLWLRKMLSLHDL